MTTREEYLKELINEGLVEVEYKDLTEEQLKGVKECLKLCTSPSYTKVMYVPYNSYLIL